MGEASIEWVVYLGDYNFTIRNCAYHQLRQCDEHSWYKRGSGSVNATMQQIEPNQICINREEARRLFQFLLFYNTAHRRRRWNWDYIRQQLDRNCRWSWAIQY